LSNLFSKIKKNKIEFFLLLSIFLLAFFLRFYRLEDFLHFADDEGRDALIIKEMVEEGKIPLLGPEASIGHFHLGPIFYYFLFPFFSIFNNQPVAGAYLVALLGIVSIYFLWKLAKISFSKEAGFFAAYLYTTSFVVILHSRWSWNLNLIPFFVLVYLYSFWKVITSKEKNLWFYLWIFALGVMLQLHASAFLFLPISLVLLLVHRPKLTGRNFLVGFLILLILFLPFFIYEFAHEFENYYKMTKMLSEQVGTQSIVDTAWNNVANFGKFTNAIIFVNFSGLNVNLLFKNIDTSYLSVLLGFLLLFTLLIFSISLAFKNKEQKGFRLIILVTFLLSGGFLIFEKGLYLHYFIIYFPLIFLFLGFLLSFFYQKIFLGKILALGFTFIISLFNIYYLANFWASLSFEKWHGSYNFSLSHMEKAVNWVAGGIKNNKINFKCEVKGYCRAFQYLFELRNIRLDQNASDSFRIYKSSGTTSRFGPIAVEKLN
jgi:4-amino-4-deoxy-L-arabinose transferase-like glycosyltransferase